ncbi:MAG: DUF3794 domain-containing protein [Clostridia bacterium]|nr:DUF3794 domain-containing protein [Clostridia bacterium]
MEVTLLKEAMRVNEAMQEKASDVTVQGDVIVPDTAPDILKILQIDGRATITGRERQGDKLVCTGVASFCVLYIPEEDEMGAPVRSLHTEMTFKDVCSTDGDAENLRGAVSAELSRIESMLLNSRKLSIKATVHLTIHQWKQAETDFVTGATADTELAMRMRKIHMQNTLSDGEFTVTAADTLEVPAEKPAVGEILKMDGVVVGQEVRVITNKAIAKGVIRLATLYLSAGPSPSVQFMEHDLPFTEILDMPGAAEGMDCTVDYDIDKIYYETDDEGDGARHVGAEVTMTLRGEATQNVEMEILEDCYAPNYDTKLSRRPCRTDAIVDSIREQLAAKKSLSLPSECPPIAQVYNVVGRPQVKTVEIHNGTVEVTGVAEVYVLYLTDDSDMPLFCYRDTVPFTFAAGTQADDTAIPSCRVTLLGCFYSLSSSGAVDLRINLDICLRLCAEESVETIENITIEEDTAEKRPSVVIAFVGDGDSLWNIAKKYRTTTAKIAAANGLEESDTVPAGTKLLIPR